jgi:hypothetical protein
MKQNSPPLPDSLSAIKTTMSKKINVTTAKERFP